MPSMRGLALAGGTSRPGNADGCRVAVQRDADVWSGSRRQGHRNERGLQRWRLDRAYAVAGRAGRRPQPDVGAIAAQ
jgi:hypothetical protein